jgi:hypothetical protein
MVFAVLESSSAARARSNTRPPAEAQCSDTAQERTIPPRRGNATYRDKQEESNDCQDNQQDQGRGLDKVPGGGHTNHNHVNQSAVPNCCSHSSVTAVQLHRTHHFALKLYSLTVHSGATGGAPHTQDCFWRRSRMARCDPEAAANLNIPTCTTYARLTELLVQGGRGGSGKHPSQLGGPPAVPYHQGVRMSYRTAAD